MAGAMTIPRRHFLGSSAAAIAGMLASRASAAPTPAATTSSAPAASGAGPIKLAISSYSYWHFKSEKVSIEKVIDHAAALEVGGVDILHRQMDMDEFGMLNAAAHTYCQR